MPNHKEASENVDKKFQNQGLWMMKKICNDISAAYKSILPSSYLTLKYIKLKDKGLILKCRKFSKVMKNREIEKTATRNSTLSICIAGVPKPEIQTLQVIL